jgi:hypothetical protein
MKVLVEVPTLVPFLIDRRGRFYVGSPSSTLIVGHHFEHKLGRSMRSRRDTKSPCWLLVREQARYPF